MTMRAPYIHYDNVPVILFICLFREELDPLIARIQPQFHKMVNQLVFLSRLHGLQVKVLVLLRFLPLLLLFLLLPSHVIF